jgi:hypothetical protein
VTEIISPVKSSHSLVPCNETVVDGVSLIIINEVSLSFGHIVSQVTGISGPSCVVALIIRNSLIN